MGLDGGTKITRSDVLRGQSWRMAQQDTSRSTRGGSVNQVYQEQQLDEETRRLVLWTTCALSGLPLSAPIVADALGQLLNKQAVLEHLLAAKSAGAAAAAAGVLAIAPACHHQSRETPQLAEDAAARLRYENQQRVAAAAAAASAGTAVSTAPAFGHITSLKDVFTVQLTPNPDLQQQAGQAPPATAASSAQELQCIHSRSQTGPDAGLWVCPVTLLPCGSKQPFSALRPCGHVLSGKALAAIAPAAAGRSNSYKATDNGDSKVNLCCCPVCDAPFDPSKDVVQVNGSQQHMDAVRARLRAEAVVRAATKQKKRQRQQAEQQLALQGSEQQQQSLLLQPAEAKQQSEAIQSVATQSTQQIAQAEAAPAAKVCRYL